MNKPHNAIEQGSLFAASFLTGLERPSGMTARWSGPVRTETKSERNPIPALCRATDPRTSRSAAEKAGQFKSRHIAKIWACLKDHGKLNYKEIAKLTGLEPVAVARRRKEMQESKLIRVLGQERNGCQLWEAA